MKEELVQVHKRVGSTKKFVPPRLQKIASKNPDRQVMAGAAEGGLELPPTVEYDFVDTPEHVSDREGTASYIMYHDDQLGQKRAYCLFRKKTPCPNQQIGRALVR